MFVAGTNLFTDSGWKKIEEISGRDRVLVRNFLGDAEFIQPFAVKKKKYEGEVVKIGAKDWAFSVTPDHKVLFDRNKYAKGRHFTSLPASEFKAHNDNRIYRKFRYMFSEESKKEVIIIRDDFGKRHTTISPHDWYKLVGYVLCRGFVKTTQGKPMLMFFLAPEKVEEEISILSDILDRIGVGWHVQYTEKTRPKLVVSSKNNLARRMIDRLGSTKRKEMFLPDKMIYNSTKELSKLLIETIIEASNQKAKVQIVTTNKAMIDSLTLLGTLAGYSVRSALMFKAGLEVRGTITKKDSYILYISNPVDTYQAKYVKREKYSGYTYGIDLFEGQVYAREKAMPVWVNPK